MNIKSLAYQTDLAFPGFDGQIIDRGNYLVILTPSIPSYYWGNYLLFDHPPGPDAFVQWKEIFAKEIGTQPNIKHEAFGWDDPSGALGHIEPFQKTGYNLFQYSVMITSQIDVPTHFNPEIVVRPVTTDTEWELAALCTASESKIVTKVNDRIQKQMASWRAVSQDNKGHWYGAFLKNEFVAGLGIYKVEDTAIIDSVVTHPNFRKQGVGRSLVYQACLHALEHLGVERLLLEADNGSAAKRMYEQLGFETIEQQVGMHKA